VTEEALYEVIRRYTREAGVRSLEREINSLCRKAVKELMTTKSKKKIKVTPEVVNQYLGVQKYRHGEAEREDQVGVVTGLAWTEVGGEILTIEALMMPGKGKMTVTGNLRDVMKESISAASSYVRSPRRDHRRQAAGVRQARHPRARAGRCDAEGWSVGRCCHGDRHRLGDDRHSPSARMWR
jgi:ATP-dependent Lon protease